MISNIRINNKQTIQLFSLNCTTLCYYTLTLHYITVQYIASIILLWDTLLQHIHNNYSTYWILWRVFLESSRTSLRLQVPSFYFIRHTWWCDLLTSLLLLIFHYHFLDKQQNHQPPTYYSILDIIISHHAVIFCLRHFFACSHHHYRPSSKFLSKS